VNCPEWCEVPHQGHRDSVEHQWSRRGDGSAETRWMVLISRSGEGPVRMRIRAHVDLDSSGPLMAAVREAAQWSPGANEMKGSGA